MMVFCYTSDTTGILARK